MAGKNIRFLERSPVKLNFEKKRMTPYSGFAILAKLFPGISPDLPRRIASATTTR